jgi:hypothetical protein
MSDPRKHHRVPQAYLRGFARQKTAKTWQAVVLDANGKRPPSNISDIFAERDWNTIKDADGNNIYDIERLLGRRVESPVGPVLQGLREGRFPLDPEPRQQLTAFMAVQLTRGRQVRENLANFVTGFNQSMLRMAVANNTDAQWMEIAGEVPSAKMKRRLAAGDGFTVKPTNALLINTLMSTTEEVGRLLSMRTWTLVEFAEPCLVSGENPVVLINPSGEDIGFGVMMAERIYMPVSPTRALVLSHPHSSWPEDRVDGDVELARRLNWAMFTFPTNEELLLHPDVESYPLPGVAVLSKASDLRWPWGYDPDSEVPVGLSIMLDMQRHQERRQAAGLT